MEDFDIDSVIAEVADAAPVPPAERVSKAPDPNLVAHIDGDVMAYTYAGPDTMPAGRCRINILKRVQQVKEFTGATRVVMHLTCGGSTKADRSLAATSRPYQGQRKKSRKPRNWSFCRDLMTDHDGSAYIPKIWKDREADDGVAYCVQATRDRCGLQVISTSDKDLRMLPGLHLNWKTWHITEVPHGRFRVVGEDELVYGHAWFWQQLIQGDSVDNIPGLHGHGPAIAEATMAQVHDNEGAYAAVAALYRRANAQDWATYMAEQASLLWLRTDRWARTADFLQLGVFSQEVQDAALALQERVEARRRELLELQK